MKPIVMTGHWLNKIVRIASVAIPALVVIATITYFVISMLSPKCGDTYVYIDQRQQSSPLHMQERAPIFTYCANWGSVSFPFNQNSGGDIQATCDPTILVIHSQHLVFHAQTPGENMELR